MTIKDLIDILQSKEQLQEVEFIVVKPDSEVVCMEIKSTAKALAKSFKVIASMST